MRGIMSGLDRILSPRHLAFWGLLASIATVAGLIITLAGGSRTQSPPAAQPTPPITSQAPAVPEQTQDALSNVASPPTPTQAPSVEKATSPITTYVDDYAQSGCGDGTTGGSVSVNGMQYTHTVQQWAGDTTSSVNLGRKASQFHATIGIRDDAQQSVRAQFFLDDESGKE